MTPDVALNFQDIPCCVRHKTYYGNAWKPCDWRICKKNNLYQSFILFLKYYINFYHCFDKYNISLN